MNQVTDGGDLPFVAANLLLESCHSSVLQFTLLSDLADGGPPVPLAYCSARLTAFEVPCELVAVTETD